MDKIKITNMINNAVTISVPEIHFKRTWPSKNATIAVDRETLHELQYDPGVQYMFEQGILYIEDMADKIDLGLEPEDAKEPQNIIVLSEKQQRDYMIKLTQKEFEEKVSKLSYEQQQALADYAVKNKLSDMNKCEFLKKVCGRDVIQSIINGNAND